MRVRVREKKASQVEGSDNKRQETCVPGQAEAAVALAVLAQPGEKRRVHARKVAGILKIET